jgi:predicted tellurium resistance membrane protein TerC
MSFEFLADPHVWFMIVTLSTLEIVLGIDNLVFISIAVGKLPEDRRPAARKFGIALACITRIVLLISLAFLAHIQKELFVLFGLSISVRDLVLIVGGIFLLVKGVMEIREMMTGGHDQDPNTTKASAVFGMVILQIAIVDIVFSLDSVITAVGMTKEFAFTTAIVISVIAILASVLVMLLAANPMGRFIDANPTIKMLALAFIVLIGVVLVLEGFHFEVDKAYLYFAMGFSVAVEWLNLLMRRSGARHQHPIVP